MVLALSERTEVLADALFAEPERSRIKRLLVESVDQKIPFCEEATSEGMERIRFSVLKLAAKPSDRFMSSSEYLAAALELAKTDWRDLFMSAGFGRDANQHNVWFDEVVGR